MSLRYEQDSAIAATEKFLKSFFTGRKRTLKELREEATKCLRHFPGIDKDGKPIFSQDNIKCQTRDEDQAFFNPPKICPPVEYRRGDKRY